MALGAHGIAYANPQDGTISAGSADISSAGPQLTVDQHSDRVIIDWRSFNIGADETTRFNQPSSTSIALNRVHDADPSYILGSLSANGRIILVNPSGIFFGTSAHVDVSGLIATTADITNADFMAGHFNFGIPGKSDAAIINQGLITAREAGLVGLVAPNVENSGIITARLGKVSLASGDTFTLDLYGDDLIDVAVSDNVGKQLIDNSGKIEAEGGTIQLTAAAGREVVDSLITVSGELKAPTAEMRNGKIIIAAAGSNKTSKTGKSTVRVSGALDASGERAGEKGGAIIITADQVGIDAGAHLHASGDLGGGTVLIGGDYRGGGILQTATHSYLASGATVDVSALSNGDGGKAVLWSDDLTQFYGDITARGAGTGAGGQVETSGHARLIATGHVDAGAQSGLAGSWLLDPGDITILGADSNISAGPNFTATGTGSTVSAASIVSALTTSDVTVTTSNDGYAGNGDITVSSAITSATSHSLTLSAYRNITINAAIDTQNGAVILQANNADTGSGAISVAANISTHGGDITLGGGSNIATGYAYGSNALSQGVNISGATVDAGSGAITVRGHGYDSGSNAYGVFVTGAGKLIAGGTVNVTGGGGGDGANANNYGVYVTGTGSTIKTTGSSLLSITGTGGNDTGSGNTNYGVRADNTNAIQAAGSGAITITGTGGNNHGTGTNNYGLSLSGSTVGIVVGNGGTITLNGTGGNSAGAGTANYGVAMSGAITNANGDIVINAAGMGVSNGFANGFRMSGGLIDSGTGTITITAARGSTDTASDFQISGGTITGGNINLFGDTLAMTGGTVTASGTLAIANRTAGTTIGVGPTSGSTLNISSAVLGMLTAGNYIFGSDTSGDVTVNTTKDFGDHNVTFISGNDLNLAGTLTKATGTGTTNYLLQADRDIYNSTNAGISATSGKINLTLDSDYDQAVVQGGQIRLVNGSFLSNGGNIVFGGSIDATTGYAYGSSATTKSGISINGTAVDAGGGNIIMHGHGYTGAADASFGVSITGTNGTVKTSGTGNMDLTGVGGGNIGGGLYEDGIGISSANGVQISGTGTATLTGTGGGVAASTNTIGVIIQGGTVDVGDHSHLVIIGNGGISTTTNGVLLYNSGIINAVGTGTVNITGYGQGAASGFNVGVNLSTNSAINAVDGNITLNGTGGTNGGSSNNGLNISAGNTVLITGSGNVIVNGIAGSGASYGANLTASNALQASGSGNITVNADTLNLNGAYNINAASGIVTIAPYTAGAAMGIGPASGSTLNLSTAMLGYITGGSYIFGSAASGDVTVNTTKDFGNANVSFISGRDISLAGTLTKASGAGTANYVFQANRDIANTASAGIAATSGAANITFDSDYDQLTTPGGSVTLTGGTFTTNGGNFIIGGGLDAATTSALSAAGTNLRGVNITSTITTGAGNVSIRGTGASGNGNAGIVSSANITTTSGNITLVGDMLAGGTGSSRTGMSISGGLIQSSSGLISVTGTSLSSAGSSYGVNIAGRFKSTGTGNIQITGSFAGSGQASNTGISITGSSARVSSVGTGTITLNGTGGAGGTDTNFGVMLTGGAIVNSSSGLVSVNAAGGGSGAGINNYGLYITGTNSAITGAGAGGVSITATGGGGSGGGNYGLYTNTSGAVTTSGSGGITLDTITGAGVSVGTGIDASSAITTTGTGNITLLADSVAFNSASSLVSIGSLTIAPHTAGATMGLGSGAGTLSLGNGALNNISAASYIFGSINAGTLTINTTHDFGDTNVSFISGQDINLSGALTKATGAGTANYLLQANRDIYNSNNAGISATSGKINLTLDSDYDQGSVLGGAIHLTNGTFASNGGNIILSGGADVNTGYAYGDAGHIHGVYIYGASVDSGAGTVLVRGHGYDTGSGEYGVNVANGGQLVSGSTLTIDGVGGGSDIVTTFSNDMGVMVNTGSTVKTTGAGELKITGHGGNPNSTNGASNDGIRISGANGLQAAGSGAITLIGYGGGTGSATSISNYGVNVYAGSGISANGGLISINGTGSNSTGGNNYGVAMGGSITNANGDITITAIAGPGSVNNQGFRMSGGTIDAGSGTTTITGTRNTGGYDLYITGGAIGTGTTTGAIKLYGDTVALTGATVQTTGTLTFANRTAGTTVGIGSSVKTLNITDAMLALLTAGSYVFGSTTSADMAVNTAYDFADKNVSFISGQDINIAGNLTKASGTGTVNYLLQANRDIYNSNNAGISATSGKINLTLDADYDQASVLGGAIYLTNGSFLSNGGNIVLSGGADVTTGYAYGRSGHADGMGISGTTIDAGSGSITARGHGYDSVGSADGIRVSAGGKLISGNGMMLTGTGGGSGTGSGNTGVQVQGANSTIKATSGTLTISGTGGAGTGGSSNGVASGVGSGITTTNAANIIINGTAGAGTSYGLYDDIASAITTQGTGNITLNTDTLFLNAANNVNSAGTLTIAPLTAVPR